MKIRIFYLLTGFVLLLFACIDDDFQSDHQHGNVENNKISFREFLKLEGNKPEIDNIKKYFQGNYSALNTRNDSLNWEIDTTQITQIITPEITTYTFQVIEYDTISGFRNVIIREYQSLTEIYLVHYPNGVDFENYSSSKVIMEQLENFRSREQAQCYELEYKCQLCGQSNCTVQPGWVLVAVECDESPGGGGGEDNPYNPGDPYDPGIPTDPGQQPIGGGGNPGNNNGNNSPTPCDLGNNLKANTNFINKMIELKNDANNTNIDYEKGYLMKVMPNNNTNYQPVQGNSGDNHISLSLQYGEKHTGFIHMHYTGLLSVFSPADIAALYIMYSNDNMKSPIESFAMGLVTAQGTTYLLVIEDANKFGNFGLNADLIDQYGIDALESLYSQWPYYITSSSTNDNNERNFAKMLKQMDSGLKLMKGNPSNFNSWETVDVDSNGNVTINPCP